MAASTRKNQFLQVLLPTLWLLTCLHFAKSLPEGRQVTCNAGSYNLFHSASIHCNFNRDLNDTRTNFNVVHYHDSSPIESGTFVLLCNWQQHGELACKVEEGYYFNNVVNTRLKLEIPELTNKQTGFYVCQVVPDDGTRVEMCTLSVIGEKTLSKSSLVTTDTTLMIIITVFIVLIFIVVFYNSLRYRITSWTKQINVCKCKGCLLFKKTIANNKSEPLPESHNPQQKACDEQTPFISKDNIITQTEESAEPGIGSRVLNPSADQTCIIESQATQSADSCKFPSTTVAHHDDQQRPHKTDDSITTQVSLVKNGEDKDGEDNAQTTHLESGGASSGQRPTNTKQASTSDNQQRNGAQRKSSFPKCLIS